MNKATRKRLDKKVEQGNTPRRAVRIVEVSDAPLLSEDVLKRDTRDIDIVEVNFANQSAQVVKSSKAPRLTHKVLRERHQPVKEVEILYDDEWVLVKVRDGRTLKLDIAEDVLRANYYKRMGNTELKSILKTAFGGVDDPDAQIEKIAEAMSVDPDAVEQWIESEYRALTTAQCKSIGSILGIDDEVLTQAVEKDTQRQTQLTRDLNTAVKHLTISEMLIDPEFSYNGKGNGYPIEERSRIGINTLFEAVSIVNTPTEDAIYQVQVLRAVPIEASILLQQGFELYPLGTLKKKNADLSDKEIEQIEVNNREQRRILVSSLLPKLNLSFNGVGRKRAYPVENLSDRCLNTLHAAYKVVCIPEARLNALRRFPAVGDRDGTGADVGSESLQNDGGEGDAV